MLVAGAILTVVAVFFGIAKLSTADNDVYSIPGVFVQELESGTHRVLIQTDRVASNGSLAPNRGIPSSAIASVVNPAGINVQVQPASSGIFTDNGVHYAVLGTFDAEQNGAYRFDLAGTPATTAQVDRPVGAAVLIWILIFPGAALLALGAFLTIAGLITRIAPNPWHIRTLGDYLDNLRGGQS